MHAVLDSSNFLTARVPATLLIALITPEVVHVPPPSNPHTLTISLSSSTSSTYTLVSVTNVCE